MEKEKRIGHKVNVRLGVTQPSINMMKHFQRSSGGPGDEEDDE